MEFLAYERPAVAVDIVLFRVRNGRLQLALVRRDRQDVENGKWALPGAFVNIDQTLKETLYTKVAAKLGFSDFSARQFAIRDNPARDDRWRVISCVFLGVTRSGDACGCEWFNVEGPLFRGKEEVLEPEQLAFDHASMIREGLDVLRNELFYKEEIFALTGEPFTLPELKATCEAVLGGNIDNFTRKTKELVEPTGEILRGKRCRPASYYRRAEKPDASAGTPETRPVTGFFGGKFLPMHKGHLYCIDVAAKQCDRVVVIMFVNGEEETEIRKTMRDPELEIPYRIEQARRVCALYGNVEFHVIDDEPLKRADGTTDWDLETPLVRKWVPRMDYVYSSEPSYGAYFARAYPEAEHVLVDVERKIYPISSTMIRAMRLLEEKKEWMV